MPRKNPETKWKEKFRPKLDALPRSWWLKTQLVALRGIPDFLGCVNGHFVAIEIKKAGASKTDSRATLQRYVCGKFVGPAVLAFEHVEPKDAEEVLSKIRFHCYG